MRNGTNDLRANVIKNGYSYEHQCWIEQFIVQRCGHPDAMNCQCFGKRHMGEHVRFSQ